MQVCQPVGNGQLHPLQIVAQQTVVSGEVRVMDDVQSRVQPPLEVAGQLLHRVLPPEEEAHVVGVQRGVDGGGVPLHLQGGVKRVSRLAGGDGAALHVGRVGTISGGDAHFAVLPQGILAHLLHAKDDFVVVAQAHGLRDVMLRRPALRAVEIHQPIRLVGEDGGEGEDDHEGDMFGGQFHKGGASNPAQHFVAQFVQPLLVKYAFVP